MLRFALIGCGRIARRHAELLGGRQISHAQLAGVCDVGEAKAEELGRRFDVPHFTDMHAMMEQVKPDVAVVLTESGNHARHVTELAAYGRSIVVEKPMALTLDGADAMIRACDRAGVRLFVVKQNRFNLPVLKLREALEQGRFGKLVLGTVRVRWWVIQTRGRDGVWTTSVRRAGDENMGAASFGTHEPDEIAVTALGVSGVASQPTVITP